MFRVFIIVLITIIYGCSDGKQLDINLENKSIVELNNDRIFSSGYFILPEGDFRGGGLLLDDNGYYFDARVVVNDIDHFFRLPLALLNLDRINTAFQFFTYEIEQKFIDTKAYSTVMYSKTGSWEVKLDKANKEETIYSGFQNGKKVFTVLLPPIINIGYIVDIGRASLEKDVDVFYFQTLKYRNKILLPIIQKAVVAYIMVSP